MTCDPVINRQLGRKLASPLGQRLFFPAFPLLHTYLLLMHSHQGPPIDAMGRPAVFTSKLEAGPQGRYLASKRTSAKPGKAGGVVEQEGGCMAAYKTAEEPQGIFLSTSVS